MDVNISILTVYAVLLVCLIATDLSYAQWRDRFMNGYDLDLPEYNTETYDREDAGNQNLIGDLLKRSLFSNYRRLPRIKQNRIIPFYSYGKDFAGYKSLPSYKSRTSSNYYVTPWNTYRPSNIYNRRIYGSFKRK